jgi:hypothetical protein
LALSKQKIGLRRHCLTLNNAVVFSVLSGVIMFLFVFFLGLGLDSAFELVGQILPRGFDTPNFRTFRAGTIVFVPLIEEAARGYALSRAPLKTAPLTCALVGASLLGATYGVLELCGKLFWRIVNGASELPTVLISMYVPIFVHIMCSLIFVLSFRKINLLAALSFSIFLHYTYNFGLIAISISLADSAR